VSQNNLKFTKEGLEIKIMRNLSKVLFVIFLYHGNCFSNDGHAAITTSGIIFNKSDKISIETENLIISENKIIVEYLFRNNSASDINAVIAFPFPDIICDPFNPMNYPDGFTVFVDGKKIECEKEIKAVIYDTTGHFKIGQDITDILIRNRIPLDCRDLGEIQNNRGKITNSYYKKLIKLGLAVDPQGDPWQIFYKIQLKCYWNQVFPANSNLSIKHEYIPSLGSENGYYEGDSNIIRIKERISDYQKFYLEHLKNDKYGTRFSYKDKYYVNLNYVLQTANTWKGPIKKFTVTFINSGELLVSSLQGPFKYLGGNMVICKSNYVPKEDLLVIFFKKKSYYGQ
jgi:hypothetical protein